MSCRQSPRTLNDGERGESATIQPATMGGGEGVALENGTVPERPERTSDEMAAVAAAAEVDGQRRPVGDMCSEGRFLAVMSCLAWALASNGLIVVNKVIMSTDHFRYPMALSSLGMFASSVCAAGACRVFGLGTHEVGLRMHLTRVLPVGFFMAVMFYFGNLCYLYISLSYIQMLKTASPIITMFALAAARLEQPSVQLVGSVLLIASGTAVTSVGEMHFKSAPQCTAGQGLAEWSGLRGRWLGFTYMLLSQVADAVRLVMTQVLLSKDYHPLEGLMHLAPACTICLWAGVFLLEWDAIREARAHEKVLQKPALYAASAFMGFLVNVTSFMVIKYTSSLTLKILGAVSNAVLVFGSCAVFGDELTALEVSGYSVSLSGFVAYNAIKVGACQEPDRPTASTQAAPLPSRQVSFQLPSRCCRALDLGSCFSWLGPGALKRWRSERYITESQSLIRRTGSGQVMDTDSEPGDPVDFGARAPGRHHARHTRTLAESGAFNHADDLESLGGGDGGGDQGLEGVSPPVVAAMEELDQPVPRAAVVGPEGLRPSRLSSLANGQAGPKVGAGSRPGSRRAITADGRAAD